MYQIAQIIKWPKYVAVIDSGYAAAAVADASKWWPTEYLVRR